MLSVKSMDNLGLLWKDWRSRVQACEGEAARSGAAKAIQFHHAKVGYIEKRLRQSTYWTSFLPRELVYWWFQWSHSVLFYMYVDVKDYQR